MHSQSVHVNSLETEHSNSLVKHKADWMAPFINIFYIVKTTLCMHSNTVYIILLYNWHCGLVCDLYAWFLKVRVKVLQNLLP